MLLWWCEAMSASVRFGAIVRPFSRRCSGARAVLSRTRCSCPMPRAYKENEDKRSDSD